MLCFGVGLYVLVTNRYLKLCGIFNLPLCPTLTKRLFYCNKTNVAASLPCLWKLVARLLRRFLQQLNLTSFTIINISLTSTTVPNDFQHAVAQTLLAKKKKGFGPAVFANFRPIFSPLPVSLPWGVPQGSVLKPLFFVINLLPLGTIFYKPRPFIFYADDCQVYFPFKLNRTPSVEPFLNCLGHMWGDGGHSGCWNLMKVVLTPASKLSQFSCQILFLFFTRGGWPKWILSFQDRHTYGEHLVFCNSL